ncbi:MAG TPA: flagellar hook-associated protein FlgK [Candidatus Sulfotelmatobacter sp.]|nr:flagellar hook-associated protein FlgK [Candidatus Sulfotelmatobacter sp.]
MSFFALNVTGSALNAFQVAENVTSDNIANEDTTGASRQVANITQQSPIVSNPGAPSYSAPGMTGDGVVVNSITRIHQNSYDSLFRGASSSQNYYTIEQQVLTSVQSSFGEPSSGINTAYANFQTALSTLAASPTTASDQTAVLTSAQALTSKLNDVGTAVSSAQSSVLQQATTTVQTVNGLLDQIASLNGQIRAASAVGANANTFEDERDNDIDQLSQYVATSTSVQANGSTLVTIGGIAVVSDTNVYHLAAPVVATGSNGEPQMVIGMESDPDPADPTPVAVGSGQLGAYVDVYNDNLSSYATQLNNFASALANTVNSVSEASYDTTGTPGQAFFVPAAAGEAITASNISVGLTAGSQVTTALASTDAGSEVVSANAANQSIDTASAILGNTTLEYTGGAVGAPPTTAGQLTVTVDGVNQTFDYDIGATGNSSTINGFITSFNAAQLGVTASWDSTNQSIVFARDPTNEGQSLLAQQAANGAATSPTFTITDSNGPQAGSAGTPTNSILQIVGASAISGVTQGAGNALGSADSAGTNAMITMLSTPVGIPPLQAQSTSPITAAGSVTVLPSTPGEFANVQVGQLLTISGGAAIGAPPTVAASETVQVTGVDPSTGAISFVATGAHGNGYSISSTPSQTLSAYYGVLVTQLGNDTATATTGTTTQTNLATSINAQRQSVDGINVDEETQNLLQYQNAYEAAAKTMSVLETLLQTALGMVSSSTG